MVALFRGDFGGVVHDGGVLERHHAGLGAAGFGGDGALGADAGEGDLDLVDGLSRDREGVEVFFDVLEIKV